MDKKGGIKNFRRKFFVSQCRKVRRGILYCCINFAYRKSLDKRGEYQDFPSKVFCLTVPKNFVGDSSKVASNSGTEKVWRRGGEGGMKILRRNFFCLTVPKISVGQSFTVPLISDSENVYGQEGGGEYQDFPSKVSCLTVLKNFVGETFSVALISGTEKVGRRGGEYQEFPSKKLCVTVPKSP